MQEARSVVPVSEPARDIGLERMIFFGDAVMAIAITLLALDLRLPAIPGQAVKELPRLLSELRPQFLAFAISFFVIGMFWGAHHRMFLHIKHYDRPLLWINLLFLFLVTAMPFPTSVLANFNGTFQGVALYASMVAAIGLVRAWLWRYATRHHRLVDEDMPDNLIRAETWVGLITAGVFVVSIGIAFLNPCVAEASWVMIAVLAFVARWSGLYRQIWI
jgi:uncharacterized membrane protein